MLAAYLGMLAWQLIWHGVLPSPLGAGNFWLVLIAVIPLLVLLPGLARMKYRT